MWEDYFAKFQVERLSAIVPQLVFIPLFLMICSDFGSRKFVGKWLSAIVPQKSVDYNQNDILWEEYFAKTSSLTVIRNRTTTTFFFRKSRRLFSLIHFRLLFINDLSGIWCSENSWKDGYPQSFHNLFYCTDPNDFKRTLIPKNLWINRYPKSYHNLFYCTDPNDLSGLWFQKICE